MSRAETKDGTHNGSQGLEELNKMIKITEMFKLKPSPHLNL
jgi:hypothetical protein